MAIKITLYRVGSNPLIVKALKDAAENGKDVTAFVELKARFDEENNIIWSRDLEQSGVKVIYGVIGLKTHCKIALVIRRENNKLKTYAHIGTGNYNHITSRLYTDVGLLTNNPDIGEDAIHLFNYLTGISKYNKWKELIIAPTNMLNFILAKIENEIEKSTPEKPGLIIAKMNQLAQREIIQALYKASNAGVRIKLIVRGVCCLKPGIPEVSENIEVRSVIGRFLEHSRIFYFQNGGDEEFYISSADWMTRNIHKRVELLTPIHSKRIQKKLSNLLDLYWKDNSKSWILQSDGTYVKNKPKAREHKFGVQEYLLNKYNKK
jgi:polyphosphate kinase